MAPQVETYRSGWGGRDTKTTEIGAMVA